MIRILSSSWYRKGREPCLNLVLPNSLQLKVMNVPVRHIWGMVFADPLQCPSHQLSRIMLFYSIVAFLFHLNRIFPWGKRVSLIWTFKPCLVYGRCSAQRLLNDWKLFNDSWQLYWSLALVYWLLQFWHSISPLLNWYILYFGKFCICENYSRTLWGNGTHHIFFLIKLMKKNFLFNSF